MATFHDLTRNGGQPLLGGMQFEHEPVYAELVFHDSPERKLLRGVLEDAIRIIQKGPPEKIYRHRQGGMFYEQGKYAEAMEWIYSEDREWPFAFRRICEVLGLSAEWIRRRLPEAKSGHRFQHAQGPRKQILRGLWNPGRRT